MSTVRVTLSIPASQAVRKLVDHIVDNGLRSMPPQFREQLARLEGSQQASDPSSVALALMLAGADSMGIDLVGIAGLKVMPKDAAPPSDDHAKADPGDEGDGS